MVSLKIKWRKMIIEDRFKLYLGIRKVKCHSNSQRDFQGLIKIKIPYTIRQKEPMRIHFKDSRDEKRAIWRLDYI